jgi:ribosomal protein S27E
MYNIINEYEDRTVRTCETCGKEAALASTGGRGSWYKTLCTECAEELGYMIIEEEDDE